MKHAEHAILEARQARLCLKHTKHAILIKHAKHVSKSSSYCKQARQARKYLKQDNHDSFSWKK